MSDSVDWNILKEILLDCIPEETKLSSQELSYLERAFWETEGLWKRWAAKVFPPKAIILGEAPLWGEKKSYILSSQGRPTAFLWPSDFPPENEKSGLRSKRALLELLGQYSILVIDLLPYALNEKSTPSMDYRRLKNTQAYTHLLHTSFKNYSQPRIETALGGNPNVRVLVRYKRTMDIAGPLLEGMGLKRGLNPGQFQCIASRNHPVDKAAFRRAIAS